jgi:hypothetical protein
MDLINKTNKLPSFIDRLIIKGFLNFKNQLFDTMSDTKITPSTLGFFFQGKISSLRDPKKTKFESYKGSSWGKRKCPKLPYLKLKEKVEIAIFRT